MKTLLTAFGILASVGLVSVNGVALAGGCCHQTLIAATVAAPATAPKGGDTSAMNGQSATDGTSDSTSSDQSMPSGQDGNSDDTSSDGEEGDGAVETD